MYQGFKNNNTNIISTTNFKCNLYTNVNVCAHYIYHSKIHSVHQYQCDFNIYTIYKIPIQFYIPISNANTNFKCNLYTNVNIYTIYNILKFNLYNIVNINVISISNFKCILYPNINVYTQYITLYTIQWIPIHPLSPSANCGWSWRRPN